MHDAFVQSHFIPWHWGRNRQIEPSRPHRIPGTPCMMLASSPISFRGNRGCNGRIEPWPQHDLGTRTFQSPISFRGNRGRIRWIEPWPSHDQPGTPCTCQSPIEASGNAGGIPRLYSYNSPSRPHRIPGTPCTCQSPIEARGNAGGIRRLYSYTSPSLPHRIPDTPCMMLSSSPISFRGMALDKKERRKGLSAG